MLSKDVLKPNHRSIRDYHSALEAFARQGVTHELGIRAAFQTLLTETARSRNWSLIAEQTARGRVRPDGTLRDQNNLPRGYWEAKDTSDKLDAEIEKKRVKGYPVNNTIFEDTRQAVLYQDGQEAMRVDLRQPADVADLLNRFFTHTEPDIEQFEAAVDEFKDRVTDLALGLVEKIGEAHRDNKAFIQAFDEFFELCKTSLNPNISRAAVDEMLVQHLLTERLMRTIFQNSDFTRRNAIAVEI